MNEYARKDEARRADGEHRRTTIVLDDEERRTPTQESVLRYVAEHTNDSVAVVCTKRGLAREIGCCTRSVEQAIRQLRKDGLLEVRPQYLSSGGQTANAYRIPENGDALLN